MKLHKHILPFLLFFATALPLFSQSQISRIEPPNWWAGMKNPAVQLLLHGKDIGDLNPTLDYAGVRIERVIKTTSPNYLFIDLFIEPTARPGKLTFHFSKNKKRVESHEWELLQRDGSDHKGFDNSDVMYLITPDRFANGDASNDAVAGLREKPDRNNVGGRHGGDIEGIRQHLDYLSDMGFTAIWLNPLLENDMEAYSYHGYSTTDFYKVDARFGSNESYRKLAQEAKSKGIKLIMDMIVNHCGSRHWWMEDLPSPDWINQWATYTGTSHRRTVNQDPHASAVDKKLFADGWFVPTMPDLNQRNPLLATYLTQNAIWWVEYLGLAGIRMDTYPYPDMDYMAEWSQKVMEEYPDFTIVGEEWSEDPAIVSYWQRDKTNTDGYTSSLPSLMDFPLQTAMSKGLNQRGLSAMYDALAMDFLYSHPEDLVVFPDNHDMSRIFTQLNEDYGLFQLAIAHTLTVRGTPQIYYGTEILMKNPGTNDHGVIRSDFPGGWANDPVNAFTGAGLTAQQKEAQAFMKKLLLWRKTASAVQAGKLVHFTPQDDVYVYFRFDDKQKVMVVLNRNAQPHSLSLDRFAEMLGDVSMGKDVVSGQGFSMRGKLEVPGKGVLVLEVR